MAEVLSAFKRRTSGTFRFVALAIDYALVSLCSDGRISGCALTCFALLGATRSIRAGNHERTNRMFRARIYAQGFTLVVLVAGSYYYADDRAKRKKFEGVVAEKKAEERRQQWIRELEARDREDQEIRAKKQAARKRAELAAVAAQPDSSRQNPEPDGQGILKAVKDLSRNG